MNIENIDIVTISSKQSVLSDDGYFWCDGFAPDQTRIIITDAFMRRMHPGIELCETLNHELLHIILEEIAGFNASVGLDRIDVWDVGNVVL